MINKVFGKISEMNHKLDYVLYGLLDPRDSKLRYIGKTQQGLKRIKQHLYPSALKACTRKNNWIKSLLKQGLEPGLQIFFELKKSNLDVRKDLLDAEIEYIASANKVFKTELYNGTAGGEGGNSGGGIKRQRKIKATNIASGEIKEYPYIPCRRNRWVFSY